MIEFVGLDSRNVSQYNVVQWTLLLVLQESPTMLQYVHLSWGCFTFTQVNLQFVCRLSIRGEVLLTPKVHCVSISCAVNHAFHYWRGLLLHSPLRLVTEYLPHDYFLKNVTNPYRGANKMLIVMCCWRGRSMGYARYGASWPDCGDTTRSWLRLS